MLLGEKREGAFRAVAVASGDIAVERPPAPVEDVGPNRTGVGGQQSRLGRRRRLPGRGERTFGEKARRATIEPSVEVSVDPADIEHVAERFANPRVGE